MKNEVKSKILTLGFIGGSTNSAVGYTHFVSSRMDNFWSLEAGCFSTNTERNNTTAQIYGVPTDRVYDNWQEMLIKEKGKLDAIVVLLPTPLHNEIVKSCLNSGFSVICEKTIAMNSSESLEILEVQRQNKSFLAVTYNYTGYPMVRELQKKIKNGEFGKIIHFQVEMPQEGFIRVDVEGNIPKPQAWRLTDKTIPTIYLDLAVHLHHLIYYLTEQSPIEVIADHNSYGWFSDVVDNVNCLCRYSEGIMGNIWFSKSALGHRNGLRLRIYGSKGSAEWFQANPEELVISYFDGRKEIIDRASSVEIANLGRYNRFKAGHPAGFIEAFANLYSDLAVSLTEYRETGQWKSESFYGVEISLKGLQFLEAMNKSVTSKHWEIVNKDINSI